MGKRKNKYSEIKGLSLREKIMLEKELGKKFYISASESKSASVVTPSKEQKQKKRKKRKQPAEENSRINKDGIEHSNQHKAKRRKKGKKKSTDQEEPEEEKGPCPKKIKKELKNKKTVPTNVSADEEILSDSSGSVDDNNIKETSKIQKTDIKSVEINKPQSDLRAKLTEKLKGSRFRYLNEQLYTCDGETAKKIFEEDPDAFQVYHEGFLSQIEKWPVKPLDFIMASIRKRPSNDVVADMGCGEARLADSVKQKVHSFDLSAVNKKVTVCEMSNVPLPNESVDHCVFCLSLMGTNLADYLREANRILKQNGILHIAEIRSRILSPRDFQRALEKLGFQLSKRRDPNDYFTLFEFKKVSTPKNKKPPGLTLKPCLYKKR